MQENNTTLSVIIPVYNERPTIEKVLKKVLSVLPKDKQLIVVDDYSSDGTRELLRDLKGILDFKLILNSQNLGKGSCIRIALSYINSNLVVVQDADLELDPSDYIKLIKPFISNEADVVFGSRLLHLKRSNYKIPTLIANRLFVYLTNLLYRGQYTDIMTGYKICRSDVLRNLKLKSKRFDIEPEIACKILKNGYRVLEFPISYYPRAWDEGKKIKWTDTFSIIKSIIKYRFID